jgi:predicted ArsR family transcriptional regulator
MSRLPTTGRLGRIARAIERETDRKTAEKVMRGVEGCVSTPSYPSKAKWVREMIIKLEDSVGPEKTKVIMESCGRKCCGVTSRKRARQCASNARTLQQLVDNMNSMRIGGGRLKLQDEHTIFGGYNRCYCGIVSKTEERFRDLGYCQCSVGWYKQLFETALGRPVEVDIKQSIINGAKSCEFVIHV